MKTFQEVTEWDAEYRVPNHVYFLNDSKEKMYGYVNSKGIVQNFTKPYKFHSRGRKFKEVANTWGFKIEDEEPEGFVKIVIGSKGERYTITEVDSVRHCTCPGYKFRGKCRHIES